MTHICINTLCLYIFYSICFCVDWLLCENIFMCFLFNQKKFFFKSKRGIFREGQAWWLKLFLTWQRTASRSVRITCLSLTWFGPFSTYIFSWPLAMLPIFLFWVGGQCWNGHKRKFFKTVEILSCIIGRCFRCDVMQLPNFTWNSDFRDGQETLMGISYFSCLSHIPLSRNLENIYHWKAKWGGTTPLTFKRTM